MGVWTGARRQLLLTTVLLLPLCSGQTEVGRQDHKNIFSTRQFHKAGLLFLPQHSYVEKSSKHSLNAEVIVDSSISRAWTQNAIFLSDRNDQLWDIICQICSIRGYTRSWYTGTGRLKKWLQAPPHQMKADSVNSICFHYMCYNGWGRPDHRHFAPRSPEVTPSSRLTPLRCRLK